VVSVRLETRDRTYGSLNAYPVDRNDFTAGDIEVAEYLGVRASTGIAASQTGDKSNFVLESRRLIGQAQGIQRAVYELDSETALQYMRRLSMDTTPDDAMLPRR
jgi:hypothetical protein